jgi:hypothetical protein
MPTGHPDLCFNFGFPDTSKIINISNEKQAIFQHGGATLNLGEPRFFLLYNLRPRVAVRHVQEHQSSREAGHGE